MSGLKLKSCLGCFLLLNLVALAPVSLAQDYQRVYDANARKYVYVPKQSTGNRLTTGVKNAWTNPVVKKGAVGAGIGVGAAALGDKGLLKGGLIGAGVGAGWGAMDKSQTLQRKPLMRHVSKGALAGAGAGAAMGGLGVLPGAVIGAGAGAATHYVKTH